MEHSFPIRGTSVGFDERPLRAPLEIIKPRRRIAALADPYFHA
jgi:hypothetical protein